MLSASCEELCKPQGLGSTQTNSVRITEGTRPWTFFVFCVKGPSPKWFQYVIKGENYYFVVSLIEFHIIKLYCL
jgi:hypothetical protein